MHVLVRILLAVLILVVVVVLVTLLVLAIVLVSVLVLVCLRAAQLPLPAADKPRMLDHERLDAYQCALQFAKLSFRILRTPSRGNSELCAIARGSAMECAAIVDLLALEALIDGGLAREAKSLLVRLVAMLSKMSR